MEGHAGVSLFVDAGLLLPFTGELFWPRIHTYLKVNQSKRWSTSCLFSALDRPLRRAAGGVFVRSADQRGAEGPHPEAGARPEHRPGHVLPSPPWRGRVRGQRHGEHPGANQRGHCDVHWYVPEIRTYRYVGWCSQRKNVTLSSCLFACSAIWSSSLHSYFVCPNVNLEKQPSRGKKKLCSNRLPSLCRKPSFNFSLKKVVMVCGDQSKCSVIYIHLIKMSYLCYVR